MPNTIRNAHSTMRSFQKFIEDQTNYRDCHRTKISTQTNEKNAQIIQQLQQKPTIIHKSKMLAMKRNSQHESIHERLFNTSKGSLITKPNSTTNTTKMHSSFKKPVEFSVYRDALRRQIKPLHPPSNSIQSTKVINKESEKRLASSISSQINKACIEHQLRSDNISVNDLKTILGDIGFTTIPSRNHTLSCIEADEENELVKEMWDYIKQNTSSNVNVKSIEMFIYSVLNLRVPNKLSLPQALRSKFQKFSVCKIAYPKEMKPNN